MDIVTNIINVFLFHVIDDLTRSNMGSSGDSEKMIQRLKDELREAQGLANTEKHKCIELQGKMGHLWYKPSTPCHTLYTMGVKVRCDTWWLIDASSQS